MSGPALVRAPAPVQVPPPDQAQGPPPNSLQAPAPSRALAQNHAAGHVIAGSEGWNYAWEEVWEDNEAGELISHQSSRLEHVCKKCDQQLDNKHIFRKHMKEKMKKDTQIVKCQHCDFMTNDETEFLNHNSDMHGPKFNCGACGLEFSDTQKRLEHVMSSHAFNYTNSEGNADVYECFDCGERMGSKEALIAHKKDKHYKTRLCSYFHGNMKTCRFPAQQCLNIHNENIQPREITDDYRSRIVCKIGISCGFRVQPGGCFYKHATNVEPQQNAWQHQNLTREITGTSSAPVTSVGRSEQPPPISANTTTLDMNQIVLNLSKQMETIAQKLQFLELKSQQDFPPLAAGQTRS